METKQEPTSLHMLIQCSLKTRVWNEHNVGGTEGSNKECNQANYKASNANFPGANITGETLAMTWS